MLSQAQRTAILELSAQGVSKHEIARVLRVSRLTVRKVLLREFHQRAGTAAGGEGGAVPGTDPGAASLQFLDGRTRNHLSGNGPDGRSLQP